MTNEKYDSQTGELIKQTPKYDEQTGKKLDKKTPIWAKALATVGIIVVLLMVGALVLNSL